MHWLTNTGHTTTTTTAATTKSHSRGCVIIGGLEGRCTKCFLVALGGMRNLQKVVCIFVSRLDFSDGIRISDNVTTAIVVLELSNDSYINMVLTGFLAQLGGCGIVILIQPIFHLNQARRVFNRIDNMGGVHLIGPDRPHQFDTMQLPPISQRLCTRTGLIGCRICLLQHGYRDRNQGLLIISLALCSPIAISRRRRISKLLKPTHNSKLPCCEREYFLFYF
mmetsp:Transcript_4784/g.8428  ORF Transcript_4784/g.8428 Transcript_4784/m.8428 type:complete len:222 (-) Transcript_4784:95-760(-)